MAHATVYADIMFHGHLLTSEEVLLYTNANSNYDTLQVRPNVYSPSPYELFNVAADHYSATGHYDNNADFYADRAVKSLVSDWTVNEGSQIVGVYRTSSIAYSVDFTNSTGTAWNTTAGQGLPGSSLETWIGSLDSSRNINVGAIGTVNMSLAASWKRDAANDDPVWADGVSDERKEMLRNHSSDDIVYGGYSRTIYGDQLDLNNGLIQMVAYDVTDLVKAMGIEYADIENAFMFTWEDYLGLQITDFDYNDMVYIMTNVTPNATPEPATMLIFGLGIAGVAAARRMKRKQ